MFFSQDSRHELPGAKGALGLAGSDDVSRINAGHARDAPNDFGTGRDFRFGGKVPAHHRLKRYYPVRGISVAIALR